VFAPPAACVAVAFAETRHRVRREWPRLHRLGAFADTRHSGAPVSGRVCTAWVHSCTLGIRRDVSGRDCTGRDRDSPRRSADPGSERQPGCCGARTPSGPQTPTQGAAAIRSADADSGRGRHQARGRRLSPRTGPRPCGRGVRPAARLRSTVRAPVRRATPAAAASRRRRASHARGGHEPGRPVRRGAR
jgi:hypothetical protein